MVTDGARLIFYIADGLNHLNIKHLFLQMISRNSFVIRWNLFEFYILRVAKELLVLPR